MLSPKIEKALNKQVLLESDSSQFYLAMASWAQSEGLDGTSQFLYRHSDEERMHMLKLIKFINERGGKAHIPEIKMPKQKYSSVQEVFKLLLEHELVVTSEINNLVDLCLKEKDYSSHNFLQWYVAEQLEEEALAHAINDKLRLFGDDKSALYFFDRDVVAMGLAADSTLKQ